jgi:hypothetical protein
MINIIAVLMMLFNLMFISPQEAMSGLVMGGPMAVTSGGGSSYSDITYYHNMDAKGDAAKSAGSATVTWGANSAIDTTDKAVGTGASYDETTNEVGWSIVATTNIADWTSCRIGMYLIRKASWDYGEMVILYSGGGDKFRVRDYGGSSIELRYRGTSSSGIDIGISTGTPIFVEFKLDGTTCTVYADGVSKGSVTGTDAASTDTDLLMKGHATYGKIRYDQLIISNDKNRDLNAIKNVTDFS